MREDARADVVLRLSVQQRLQHLLLIVTMLALAVTGLALSFSETWIGTLLIRLEGGIEARGNIHRLAALVLGVLAVWHAWYVVFTEEGHQELMAIKPRLADLGEAIRSAKRSMGMEVPVGEMHKYSPSEKFQYWGVVIGTLVMGATGAVLWFRVLSMAVLPKWAIDLTLVIHGSNGLLAFLVLVLWHLYNVHLAPGRFPNATWLTGRSPGTRPFLYSGKEVQGAAARSAD